jgi:hypothetical protein
MVDQWGVELGKFLPRRIIRRRDPTLSQAIKHSSQIQEKLHFDTVTTDAVAFGLRAGTA